jgi:ADP-ribosylglycohydrolase
MAVGDALGLPLEGLSPRRARKLFGEINESFGMRLCFGRGLVSDDTEHALLTLHAFIAAQGDPIRFERALAWRLRLWFLQVPPGIGLATAKACLKLLIGISPSRSGIRSAGNGPAMRAPVLGVVCPSEEQLRSYVRVATRLTHTDPKAEIGALTVALAARHSRDAATTGISLDPNEFLMSARKLIEDSDWDLEDYQEFLSSLERVVQSVAVGQSTANFALSLGLSNGVSGYIFHTVPVVLHAWLTHQNDFRAGVLACLRCGGDSDSTAAIAGGIIGACVGKQGVPHEWLCALAEWPRNLKYMERLATASTCGETLTIGASSLWVPARNALLLLIILFHGFRRLLPPY